MTSKKDDTAAQTDLDRLRNRVRTLDDQILAMLAERNNVAREIGSIKRAQGWPIKNYQVEKQVVDRSRATASKIGLYQDMAADVTQLLIRYAVIAQDEDHQKNRPKQAATAGREVFVVGGAGLMGQWLCRFFRSFNCQVTVVDQTENQQGYPQLTTLPEQLKTDQLVVLATPISATAQVLEEFAARPPGPLIFDVCSLKSPLLAAIDKVRAAGHQVTSIHPMFGPDEEVLAGRNILICDSGLPTATTAAEALFADTTANVVTIPLARHDELMGYVLGLSHLFNLVFAHVVSESGLPTEELAAAASTTFHSQLRVTTPVVHENPDLYYEIQAENAFTPELVTRLAQGLQDYAEVIAAKDRDGFRKYMEGSREWLAQLLK